MPKELTHPSVDVVEKTLAEAVYPILADFEAQLKRPLPTLVAVSSPHMQGPAILITAEGHVRTGARQCGEIRLYFRETAVPGRLVFRGEAIYSKDISPDTGWSGFDLRGEARIEADGVKVTPGPWAVKYNKWEFRGWK
jgi:hypothetical protein